MKEIQLNGTSHKIRFNFNALKAFKVLNGGDGLNFEGLDPLTVVDLCFVGIQEGARIDARDNNRENDFKLTIEDVGEHMTTALITEVMTILTEDLNPEDSGKK